MQYYAIHCYSIRGYHTGDYWPQRAGSPPSSSSGRWGSPANMFRALSCRRTDTELNGGRKRIEISACSSNPLSCRRTDRALNGGERGSEHVPPARWAWHLSLCVQAEVRHSSTQTLPAIIPSGIWNQKASGRLNGQFGFTVSNSVLQRKWPGSLGGVEPKVVLICLIWRMRGDSESCWYLVMVEVVKFTGVILILSLLETYNDWNIRCI